MPDAGVLFPDLQMPRGSVLLQEGWEATQPGCWMVGLVDLDNMFHPHCEQDDSPMGITPGPFSTITLRVIISQHVVRSVNDSSATVLYSL